MCGQKTCVNRKTCWDSMDKMYFEYIRYICSLIFLYFLAFLNYTTSLCNCLVIVRILSVADSAYKKIKRKSFTDLIEIQCSRLVQLRHRYSHSHFG